MTSKVVEYTQAKNITIDIVVPLLRGGNIPATYLTYALKVLAIRPVQYKYFFLPGKCELRRILSFDYPQTSKPNPNIYSSREIIAMAIKPNMPPKISKP